MIQQGRPKQLVDQLSPHRCREWHSDQTSDCLRLMPSLGGEHPSKKQKSEEVTSKPSDGPKLDSVRAPARGSKVEWHGIGRKRQIWELRILSEMPLQRCCLPRMVCFSLLWLSFSRRPCHSSTPTFKQSQMRSWLPSGWLARSASLPLLGGSSSSSLFFHSFYAKGYYIYIRLCMQDVLGSHKIIYENKALLVQFGRTRVSKTRCRRFKSYRAWFHSC